MYKLHSICRACGYGKPNTPPGIKSAGPPEQLIPVFNLGIQPLPNDFKKPDEEHAGFAPLQLLFCPRCTLAQLSVVVRPEILYSNYPYVTSKSDTMREHFSKLWSAVKAECNPVRVIEIGSNDGEFLKFAKANGAERILGIDPAENLAAIAIKEGVTTIPGVFNDYTANIANGMMPAPDLVMARHVFAHIDDWQAFIRNLATIASHQTLVVLEVPYVMNLLQKVELDTCYHEHLSYISIKAMEYLLRDTPFHLHKVLRFDIHGGAIAMMLRWNDSDHPVDAGVGEFLAAENITIETWQAFDAAAHTKIRDLKKIVAEKVYGEGATVCGFGASAKSTVWINACGFTRKEIAFICDNTPQKQGRMSPGSDILIVDEGALLRDLPEYAVMFCWNFKEFVLEKQARYLELGGKFIVPVPEIEVIGKPQLP